MTTAQSATRTEGRTETVSVVDLEALRSRWKAQYAADIKHGNTAAVLIAIERIAELDQEIAALNMQEEAARRASRG